MRPPPVAMGALRALVVAALVAAVMTQESPTETATGTATASGTASSSLTASATPTATESATPSETPPAAASPSESATAAAVSASPSGTPPGTASATSSASPSASATMAGNSTPALSIGAGCSLKLTTGTACPALLQGDAQTCAAGEYDVLFPLADDGVTVSDAVAFLVPHDTARCNVSTIVKAGGDAGFAYFVQAADLWGLPESTVVVVSANGAGTGLSVSLTPTAFGGGAPCSFTYGVTAGGCYGAAPSEAVGTANETCTLVLEATRPPQQPCADVLADNADALACAAEAYTVTTAADGSAALAPVPPDGNDDAPASPCASGVSLPISGSDSAFSWYAWNVAAATAVTATGAGRVVTMTARRVDSGEYCSYTYSVSQGACFGAEAPPARDYSSFRAGGGGIIAGSIIGVVAMLGVAFAGYYAVYRAGGVLTPNQGGGKGGKSKEGTTGARRAGGCPLSSVAVVPPTPAQHLPAGHHGSVNPMRAVSYR